MKIISNLQWLIAGTVLVHGFGQLPQMGTTGMVFVLLGLIFCALAAWVARLTLVPLGFATVINSVLAWAAWRFFKGTVSVIPINTRIRGRTVSFADYIHIDTVV